MNVHKQMYTLLRNNRKPDAQNKYFSSKGNAQLSHNRAKKILYSARQKISCQQQKSSKHALMLISAYYYARDVYFLTVTGHLHSASVYTTTYDTNLQSHGTMHPNIYNLLSWITNKKKIFDYSTKALAEYDCPTIRHVYKKHKAQISGHFRIPKVNHKNDAYMN